MNKWEQIGIHGVDFNNQYEQRFQCPQCSNERHKYYETCLSVNVSKASWHCWHCGWSGHITGDKITHETLQYKSIPEIEDDLTDDFLEYFYKRGISKTTLDAFRVKQTKIRLGASIKPAMAFPFFWGYNIVNYKFRTLEKDFKQAAGIEQALFMNINIVDKFDTINIVEGEIDLLSMHEAGFENTISVPSGAPPANAKELSLQMKYIDNSIEILDNVTKFILAVDNDAPGRRLQEELARRLGKNRCFIVKYPPMCKDSNDVLIKYGEDELKRVINNAEPYPVEGIFRAKQLYDELLDIYNEGFPNGMKSHLSTEFDDLIKFLPGHLTIISGLPNSGKSPMLDQLLMHMAKFNGQRSVVFSPENGKVSIHITRLLRQYTGKNILPGYNGRANLGEFNEAMDFIDEYFRFISPEDNRFSLEKILERFTYIIQKYGVNYVVIDPWNRLEHLYKNNQTDYVAEILSRLQYYAQKMNIHFFMVAHPTKIPIDERTGQYRVPTMYDISGSANWFNIPEAGIVIYRRYSKDKKETLWTDVYVQKMKFDFLGKTGNCKFQFNVASQLFEPYESSGKEDTETSFDYKY
jgi:twinkle protein